MIKLDVGGEEFVFENEWDIAVPITVRKKDGGEAVIEVFPSYENEAKEFLRIYGDDPFTDEALSYIWESIGTKMRDRGYEEDANGKFRDRFYYTYVIKSREQINSGAILPSTVKLSKKAISRNHNMTTFDLPLYIEEEMTSFVTVLDGKVLSIASENRSCSEDFDDEGKSAIEIGVETAVEARGQGYASSNASALCRELIDDDCYITYETDKNNIASQKCAERAGFHRYGRCYYYVMRRIYED